MTAAVLSVRACARLFGVGRRRCAGCSAGAMKRAQSERLYLRLCWTLVVLTIGLS